MSRYNLPDEMIVFLVRRANDGPYIVRKAAQLLLACLRARKTPREIRECLDAESPAVSSEARTLAKQTGVRLTEN